MMLQIFNISKPETRNSCAVGLSASSIAWSLRLLSFATRHTATRSFIFPLVFRDYFAVDILVRCKPLSPTLSISLGWQPPNHTFLSNILGNCFVAIASGPTDSPGNFLSANRWWYLNVLNEVIFVVNSRLASREKSLFTSSKRLQALAFMAVIFSDKFLISCFYAHVASMRAMLHMIVCDCRFIPTGAALA